MEKRERAVDEANACFSQSRKALSRSPSISPPLPPSAGSPDCVPCPALGTVQSCARITLHWISLFMSNAYSYTILRKAKNANSTVCPPPYNYDNCSIPSRQIRPSLVYGIALQSIQHSVRCHPLKRLRAVRKSWAGLSRPVPPAGSSCFRGLLRDVPAIETEPQRLVRGPVRL